MFYTFHTIEESHTLAVPEKLKQAVDILTGTPSRGEPVSIDDLPEGRKFIESETFAALTALGLMEL